MKTISIFAILFLILFSIVLSDDAYGSLSLDKGSYSWTDKVKIRLMVHGFDHKQDTIQISVGDNELKSYKLSKAGNGLYTGEVILTGFLHDVDGDGKPDTNPRTTGSGPNNGFLESTRDEKLEIIVKLNDGTKIKTTTKIAWNVGEISFDMSNYQFDGTAKLQAIDPDMNLNPETLDKLPIHVFSDSDKAGILVDAIETQEESGIFETTVTFTQNSDSSGNRVFAMSGDAIYAQYTDHTLPESYHIHDDLDIVAESALHDSLIAEFSSNIYQIPNVDFDKHSYTWGEQGKLFMVSPLDNKDSQKIEVITTNSPTFKSKIYTYPDSTTQENFVLTETGPDTGLFEWTFVISEPQTKTAYDINSNYIVVSESTEHITFQFDVDQNTGYSATAKVTYPDDNTLPSDEQRQRASMYPNVQFKMTEKTSTYDADGIISVQFPSQNKSPTAIDQLKVVFGQRNVNSIFEILDETGPDTGIFEGTLSLSTIPSFSKFQITQNNNPSSRINIQFLEADVTFSSISHALALYHDLEFPDDTNIIHNDSRLSVHSDKKAYLAGKEIQISGFSEPDETINVTLLAHKGSGMFFEKVQSDKNGEFKTELILPDDASSGMYSLAATSTKNDKQEITSLIVTSIDALESHSISVPPLQQSKMGLGADQIVCKQVWKSVLKPGGEIPACVKLPTYHKLLERGWIPVS